MNYNTTEQKIQTGRQEETDQTAKSFYNKALDLVKELQISLLERREDFTDFDMQELTHIKEVLDDAISLEVRERIGRE